MFRVIFFRESISLTKFFYPFVVFLSVLVSCTHKPDVHTPDDLVMHFPIYSKVSSNVFLATSSSADGKYDFGRLSMIKLDAISSGISPQKGSGILNQEQEISSVLIPKESGPLEVSSDGSLLMFTLVKDQAIVFMPFNEKLDCKKDEIASKCQNVVTHSVSIHEPSSIASLTSGGQNFAIAGSLSESQIEIVSFNGSVAKTEQKHELSQILETIKKNKQTAFSIRQIKIDNNSPTLDTFILLEEQKVLGFEHRVAKNTYLIKAKWDVLINQTSLKNSDVDIWDLRSEMGVNQAVDFVIDNASNQLILLASRPEILFKINLANKDLLKQTNVCKGASMLAFDKVNNQLYVPCFYDDTVIKIAQNTFLTTAISARIPGGPLFISVDSKRNLVLVSSFNQGVVEVLGSQLEPYGYLFNKAPKNRVGS